MPPSNFLNLVSRLFWPNLSAPVFAIESADIYKLPRSSFLQVNVTARLEGQIPADQCAWLVEFVSPWEFHPKRALPFAFAWQRYVSESYITSGDPAIQRRPGVVILPRYAEPVLWRALSSGRANGRYTPLQISSSGFVAQVGQVTVAAVGNFYSTEP